MQYYNRDSQWLLSHFNSSMQGLDDSSVLSARSKYGENILNEEKKPSVFKVFLSQFLDLLVIILIIAAIISMFSGNAESTLVIFFVLIMNAVLGTIQHIKAEKSLSSLKELSSPYSKVMRNNVLTEIPSKEIVPGDILMLEAGDMITADGRILTNHSLMVNESALTGETSNIEKNESALSGDIPLAERKNMVYSGSLVTYGRATVLVTDTAMNTEIGKIAVLMNQVKNRKTPLQKSLDNFSQKLAILIMVISIVVMALCMYRQMPVLDSLMFAVALAVAAIPEALSSIVTIVQASGTAKMAKENAIIKELKAVESLGCVSVICSDKTGTLTENKMTVMKLYINNSEINPENLDIHNIDHRHFLYNAILNNDSSSDKDKIIGDPTEFALIQLFRNLHISTFGNDYPETDEELIRFFHNRLEEIPFDSDRKLMSSKYIIHNIPTIFVKGAPDVILNRITHIRKNNAVYPVTPEDINNITEKNKEFSTKGLRVLAFAYKESNEPLTKDSENMLVFSGLVAMADPPRKEAVLAVARGKEAGIKTIMITGDHKITATAIAKELGIFNEGDIAITGQELDAMSDKELDSKIEKISVYARVSPENKIRIVEAWQRKGRITAMTGDGVNDAPALKKADIGVAMGITGTEVSKDAADMILTDDNFATIIKAVINGRNVYRNIKNAILFLLSGNMAAIICVLVASIIGISMPFQPVHLLFINLLTDSLPAIAIGMEKADNSLIHEKPRDPSESILNKDFLVTMFLQGGLIAISVMSAYFIGLKSDVSVASTMAFATLTLSRLFHGFNCRTKQPVFSVGIFSNKYSIAAFLSGLLLLASVLTIPILERLFVVSAMSGIQLIYILLLGFIPTFIIQLSKYFVYFKHKL